MKTSSQDLGVVCKSTFWSVLKKKQWNYISSNISSETTYSVKQYFGKNGD